MLRLLLLFCIISSIIFFVGFKSGQKPNAIILHDEKFNFTPHEFYVADVIDERANRASVASLITFNAARVQVSQLADLQGGAAPAIKQFIDRNLQRDSKQRAVVVTIKEFRLTESALANGRIGGRLVVSFSFGLHQGESIVYLTDYSGGIRYERPVQQIDAAEPTLRRAIQAALSDFNKWMIENADTNILLAKSVKVDFTDYTQIPEGDTIYYSVNRPLTWKDFKERNMGNRFEAEIFTSIGYTEHTEVVKGVVKISIAVKVDLPKNDCWVRAGSAKDSYTLNHEQRHFDIGKLVSEHFKKKILAMNLPVDNYDGPINVEYLETLREATRMQKQYDAETQHGIDHYTQSQWNEKIDKELKELGIKK